MASKSRKSPSEKFTSGPLKRMSLKAGVKSVSTLAIEEVKLRLPSYIEGIVEPALIFARSGKRGGDGVRISLEAMKYAIAKEGFRRMYGSVEDSKKCPITKLKGLVPRIKFYQRQDDCLYLPKSVFKALVKEQLRDMRQHGGSKATLEGAAVETLQSHVEDWIIFMFENTYKITMAAKRTTISKKDIQTFVSIFKAIH